MRSKPTFVRSRRVFCRGVYVHLTPWQTLHLDKLPAALVKVVAGKTFNTYRCPAPAIEKTVQIARQPID